MDNTKTKHYLSVRLIPSIFLALASVAYSFAYLDNRYAETSDYLQAAGYFGIALVFLLIDIGVEAFCKTKDIAYNIFSTLIAFAQMFYFILAMGTYLTQLTDAEDPSKRLFPSLLLVVILLTNLAYRILTWINKWKVEEEKGNDLIAAYIGFLGLGTAFLNSFPFSAITIYAADQRGAYLGIFADIALGVSVLEALIGIAWLSWGKLKNSSKSNIFFYLTILNLLTSLAVLIVTAFSYFYETISIIVSTWCFAFYATSCALSIAGLVYLNCLLRK